MTHRYSSDLRYSARRQGDFIGALTDAVRDNPMSAALIGVGALWLYMGGNRTSLAGGHGRTSLVGAVAHGASEVGHGAAHAAERVGSAVSSGVSSAADYVRESVAGVDAEAAYRNPEAYGDMGPDDSRPWNGRRSSGGSTVGRMQQNMREMFERHPVAIGLAGLALGAGMAASLPLTRKERQVMGPAGEAVQDRLGEAAERARAMADAAVDEARRQSMGNGGGNPNA